MNGFAKTVMFMMGVTLALAGCVGDAWTGPIRIDEANTIHGRRFVKIYSPGYGDYAEPQGTPYVEILWDDKTVFEGHLCPESFLEGVWPLVVEIKTLSGTHVLEVRHEDSVARQELELNEDNWKVYINILIHEGVVHLEQEDGWPGANRVIHDRE
jgi:hypothetical protein